MTHETYRGYRGHLEHGFWVWYRELPKHLVGYHPDKKKPIRLAKSGFREADLRIPTNTGDYEVAKQMLDNKLTKPKKKTVIVADKQQQKMF